MLILLLTCSSKLGTSIRSKAVDVLMAWSGGDAAFIEEVKRNAQDPECQWLRDEIQAEREAVNMRHTAVEQAGGAIDVDMEDQEERALARAIRMGKMRLEIAGLEGKHIEIQSNNVQKRFEIANSIREFLQQNECGANDRVKIHVQDHISNIAIGAVSMLHTPCFTNGRQWQLENGQAAPVAMMPVYPPPTDVVSVAEYAIRNDAPYKDASFNKELGRLAASEYRKVNNEEPESQVRLVNGVISPVKCYILPKDEAVLRYAMDVAVQERQVAEHKKAAQPGIGAYFKQ